MKQGTITEAEQSELSTLKERSDERNESLMAACQGGMSEACINDKKQAMSAEKTYQLEGEYQAFYDALKDHPDEKRQFDALVDDYSREVSSLMYKGYSLEQAMDKIESDGKMAAAYQKAMDEMPGWAKGWMEIEKVVVMVYGAKSANNGIDLLSKDKVKVSEKKPNEQVPPNLGPNPEVNKIIPENFTSKITEHNTQLGALNKKKDSISGAHKQDAFLESVEMVGAKINLKVTDKKYPGLIEYQYQIPSKAGNGPNAGKVIGYKKEQSKTTYDSTILSDAKVADMSNKAAKQSESYFLSNPTQREHSIKVDGYWFRVTRDAKTGEISNSFITMPPRSIQ